MKFHTWIAQDALAKHLGSFGGLSVAEADALGAISGRFTRKVDARRDLLRERDRPKNAGVLLAGCACSYKVLEDGRRQILSFLVPGDLYAQGGVMGAEMDHSICAVSPMTIGELPLVDMQRLVAEHAGIARALQWASHATAATQREWTLSLGQRNSCERIAHLVCELFYRLRAVGLTEDDGFDTPITQMDIAEACGMTSVHVNRTLRDMRAEKLLILRGRRLIIPDLRLLAERAMFAPRYLHLGGGTRSDSGFIVD